MDKSTEHFSDTSLPVSWSLCLFHKTFTHETQGFNNWHLYYSHKINKGDDKKTHIYQNAETSLLKDFL